MVCGWRDHRLPVVGGVQTLPQRGEQKVPEHGLNLREGLQGPETQAGSGHVGSALTSASDRPSPAARDGGHRILGQQGGSHMQGATPSPNPTHISNLSFGERLHISTDGLSKTKLGQDGEALVMFMEDTRVAKLGETFYRKNTAQSGVREDSQVCCVIPRTGNHRSTWK